MKRRFCSLNGHFGSIYRRFCLMSGWFCSMNRRFQLTCLHCTLKIHHTNKYWETKGTLSLRQNHYGSYFLPFLAQRKHFDGGTFTPCHAFSNSMQCSLVWCCEGCTCVCVCVCVRVRVCVCVCVCVYLPAHFSLFLL